MLPQAEKRKASRPSSGFLKEYETPSDHILESAFNHSNQKVFSRLQKTQGWGTRFETTSKLRQSHFKATSKTFQTTQRDFQSLQRHSTPLHPHFKPCEQNRY
jgi:hypothetical protein